MSAFIGKINFRMIIQSRSFHDANYAVNESASTTSLKLQVQTSKCCHEYDNLNSLGHNQTAFICHLLPIVNQWQLTIKTSLKKFGQS